MGSRQQRGLNQPGRALKDMLSRERLIGVMVQQFHGGTSITRQVFDASYNEFMRANEPMRRYIEYRGWNQKLLRTDMWVAYRQYGDMLARMAELMLEGGGGASGA